jgi:replication factor A1
MRNLIESGTLDKGSIIELEEYLNQVVQSKKETKRIIVLSKIHILSQYGRPEKIGEPVSLDTLGFNDEVKADQNQPQGIGGGQFYGNGGANAGGAADWGKPEPQKARQEFSERHGVIHPIESLSPYSNKWTIRARVTSKSPVRTWHNEKGEGRLFSVNLLDESGEIKAAAFGGAGEVFDHWYELLQENGVYYITSPCMVKLANKKFNTLNHDYELAFDKDTRVEKANDMGSVPQIRYNFVNIQALQEVDKDTTIDCIGVVKEIGEVGEFTAKSTNKPYSKREITLVDDTRHQVRLTIWGAGAQNFEHPLESVIAFKGVKVSDFGGRSLSLLASGSMQVDPDLDEAHKLKGWYDAQGRTEDYATHSAAAIGQNAGAGRDTKFKYCAELTDDMVGFGSEGEYFNLKATVMYIKQGTMYYAACQTERCNRKVTDHEPNEWKCENCNKVWPRPLYRYILQLCVADHTGQKWISAFDESSKVIMGVSADELAQVKEDGDENKSTKMIEDATCKTWNFRCRAKMDNYNDEQR